MSLNLYTTLLALFFLLLFWTRKPEKITFPFSSLFGFTSSTTPRVSFAHLPERLLSVSLLFFALALCDLHFVGQAPSTSKPSANPREGVALYLVMDQSGSMGESIALFHTDQDPKVVSKIDLLKQVTNDFVWGNAQKGLEGRPNDLIGLVTFARTAHVQIPLTLDRSSLKRVLDGFSTVDKKEDDGTALGYAIFKTANVLHATQQFAKEKAGLAPYEIESAAMIVVTDGFQDPNPLDRGNRLRNISLEEASEYAKESGIRLYLISVDPRMATQAFSAERNLLEQVAATTGGKFFLVTDQKPLHDVYREIDQLEKGAVESPEKGSEATVRTFSFFPFFLFVGLVALFLSHFLQSTMLKTFP